MFLVVLEAWVAGPEASVGDVAINAIGFKILQRLLIVIATVDGDFGRGHDVVVFGVEVGTYTVDRGFEQTVFLALSVGMRLHNDLMFGIHRGHTSVALDNCCGLMNLYTSMG